MQDNLIENIRFYGTDNTFGSFEWGQIPSNHTLNDLTQTAKVVFADEARGAVAHRIDVEVPDGEKVLVVSRAAREARRDGGCDGLLGVDATWIKGGRMASRMWSIGCP